MLLNTAGRGMAQLGRARPGAAWAAWQHEPASVPRGSTGAVHSWAGLGVARLSEVGQGKGSMAASGADGVPGFDPLALHREPARQVTAQLGKAGLGKGRLATQGASRYPGCNSLTLRPHGEVGRGAAGQG